MPSSKRERDYIISDVPKMTLEDLADCENMIAEGQT